MLFYYKYKNKRKNKYGDNRFWIVWVDLSNYGLLNAIHNKLKNIKLYYMLIHFKRKLLFFRNYEIGKWIIDDC